MSDWTLEAAIERTGVLKKGHFLLSSGRHSDQYMQMAQLLQYPREAKEAGDAVAKLFLDQEIDLVVGPALGGVIIAHEVARALGVRCIFAERKEGEMQIRRGFEVNPRERVLVIEDVVTTGGSVKEVISLLEEREAEIIGVGSLVDRTKGENPFDVPYKALKAVQIESYSAEDCPLCKDGISVVKPGSRHKK
ncbi:orotate phosphoribosyltransferase [Shimazuella sp. AN120528]|uniref:orotate phosphoribosyltransferase n=1 Tax=Shimazuella soli TaxID=1892854 RepID=UPI001F0FC739|nr:orotate phosphoribosyltransferase [Shimazuella soli]MCH5584774.1 orotate phosphoribosyltransferase [Shimazuella soli]